MILRKALLPAAMTVLCFCDCSADSPPSSIASTGELSQASPAFTFSQGTCELGPNYCALREPKDWTDEDKALVESGLREISASALGRRVVQAAYEKGYTTFRRYRVYAERTPTGAFQTPDGGRTAANQHANNYGQWIDVNDPIRTFRGLNDARGGYSIVAEIILHEFFHGLDRNAPGVYSHSSSREFWKLVGFREIANGFQYMFLFQSQADRANGLRAASMAKAEAGLLREWWEMNRSDGWTPLPSEVAATKPREAFAEIGAHLVLDPTARMYLDPTVVQYFDREVFGRM